jgi:hypothetical protein
LTQNVHYRVQKSPPLLLILSQMHPIQTFPTLSLKSVLILSSLVFWVISSLEVSRPKFYTYFSYPCACYLHNSSISCTLIWFNLTLLCLVKRSVYEAPHYYEFSKLYCCCC